MSEAGVIIGRVAVKVTPDLKGFYAKTLAGLKRIEARLPDVKIGVDLDSKSAANLRRQIENLTKDASKDIGIKVDPESARSLESAIREVEQRMSKLREVSIGNPKSAKELQDTLDILNETRFIELDIDSSSKANLDRALAQIDSELDKMKTVRIDVDVNEDSLRTMRDSIENDLRDIEIREIRVRNDAGDRLQRSVDDLLVGVRLDGTLSPAEANRVRREIERSLLKRGALEAQFDVEMDNAKKREILRDIEDIDDKLDKLRNTKADIEPNMNEAAYRHTQARMAWLARTRIVRLVPLVDSRAAAAATTTLAALSGARGLGQVFRNLWNSIKDLDKSVPLIGSLALLLSGVAGWGITAASNMFTLAQSLARIGPAALTLPGIFAGIAIGVGASVAALKDFNDVFPDIKGRLSALQDQMSGNFWKVAQKPFREFFEEIFPQFSEGIKQSSTDLGGFYGAFATALKGQLTGSMATMFDGLNESIRIATGSTEDMARSITILGLVGARNLPRLATWWNDINKRFSEWLALNEDTGQLQEWIDRALVNLRLLGSIIGNLGGIFAGVSRAFEKGGGSDLASLDATLERVRAAVNGDVFQDGFSRVVKAAHSAMTTIATLSRDAWYDMWRTFPGFAEQAFGITSVTIGTLLSGLFTGLSQPMFQQGILDFLKGIQSIVVALAPVMPSIASAFGALATALGALLTAIAPALAPLFQALADALIILAPHLETMVTALGTALVAAIMALIPYIPQLTEIFILLMTAIAEHPEVFLAIATALWAVAAIAPLIGPMLGVISTAIGLIGSGAVIAILGIGLLVGALVALLLAFQVVDIGSLPGMDRIKVGIDNLKLAFEEFGIMVSQVFTDLKEDLDIFNRSSEESLTQASADWAMFTEFVSISLTTIGILMQIQTASWGLMWQIFGGIITEAINLAMAFIGDKIRGTLEMLTGLMTAFVGLTTGDWDMMWAGMKQATDGFGQATTAGMGKLMGDLNLAQDEGATVLKSDWDTLWGGYPGVIDGAKPLVVSATGDLTDEVVAKFTADLLSKPTKPIMDNLSGAIQAGRQPAGSAAKSVASNVEAQFPQGLLAPAGSKIISGLAGGILAGMRGALAGALSRVTQFIKDNKGPISYDRVMLIPAGLAIMDGLANGILAGRSQLQDALKMVSKDIASHDYGSPVLANVPSNPFGEAGPGGSTGDAKYHIQVNAETKGATAQEVADEVLHAARRIDYGGVYARRTA